MADKEQLAILKQGVKAWNEWRLKNPSTIPDLSRKILREKRSFGMHFGEVTIAKWELSENGNMGATLSGVDFSKVDLREADLRGADLIEADLHVADLRGADLREADLSGANLEGATLSGADLSRADLSGTDFSGANLYGANLHEVDLREADLREVDLNEADLREAVLFSTVFNDVDLSEVRGLEEVRHAGPSEISISTIYKSKGKIPDKFLRGCGVPDDMIDVIRGLLGTAIEFYSCFISYSNKDDGFAKRVYADLQSNGVRVWFAPEDLKIGDKFPTKIDEAIRVYDKLMLVLSKNSINSTWVRHEVQTALAKEKKEKRVVLFPIRLDDAFLKTTEDWADDIRRNRHVGDFKQWKEHDSYQKAFERLLRDLKQSEAT